MNGPAVEVRRISLFDWEARILLYPITGYHVYGYGWFRRTAVATARRLYYEATVEWEREEAAK